MAVSSDDFERYCRAIEAALGSCATPKQVEKIAALAEVMANGSTLEARNAARSSIAETLQGLYSRSANLQAAAVDDFCRSVLGISPSPIAFSMPKEQALQQIGYMAGDLFENGDAGSFSRRACDWVTKKATPVANQKMEANCERAYGKGKVRYALVPAGGDICTFCVMLASRGFVYKSGVKFKTHDHCTCKLMPETKGGVDGYDPDSYYKQWRESGVMLEEVNWKKSGDPRTYEQIRKDASVIWSNVDGGKCRKKLSTLVGNTDSGILEECMTSALKHRDGTLFEDLYAVNLSIGAKSSVLNSKTVQGVRPTKKMLSDIKGWIANGDRVVYVHNHPESGIPSMNDIRSLRDRGGEYGIIACHDGSVYKYSIVGNPIEGSSLDDDSLFNYINTRRTNMRREDDTFATVEERWGVRIEHVA